MRDASCVAPLSICENIFSAEKQSGEWLYITAMDAEIAMKRKVNRVPSVLVVKKVMRHA